MKTTKNITEALTSLNPVTIYRVAKHNGVDINRINNILDFAKKHVSYDVYRKINNLLWYEIPQTKAKRNDCSRDGRSLIARAINYAKQCKNGSVYQKILIEGNNNIYWASPIYGHADYNKSIAFPNTEEFRKISVIINNFINK